MPQPRSGIETAFLAPEAVLLDTVTGASHHLNAGASAVWMLLDGSGDVEDVARELAELFDRPVEGMIEEVRTAVADFAERGLLAGTSPANGREELAAAMLHRPPDPGGSGASRPVWAGVEVFQAGNRVVGIEYDSAEMLDALRARCRDWLPEVGFADDLEVPAAFGVRTAKVGFRRRRVGVVHHGAPVRYRLDNPDEAVDVIARILADLAAERPPNTVTVDARCFVRGGRAVLIDIPPSRVVDERPLRAAAIVEIPTWRPTDRSREMTRAGRGHRVGLCRDRVSWPSDGRSRFSAPASVAAGRWRRAGMGGTAR